jgi:RNA polymerase sigma-70 factor (ECF subfamily)
MAAEDPNWQVWLAAAQGGDQAAYAALLRAALPWLRRRARSRWPSASAADIEDMVQETLLALHQSRHLYDPARPVEPFIYGILKLRGADVRRRRARHVGRETVLDDVALAVATPAGQEQEAEQAGIMAALSRLNDRDRQILDALKVRQLSLKEAAVETGINIVALKVASFRAMQRLKRALKGGADAD